MQDKGSRYKESQHKGRIKRITRMMIRIRATQKGTHAEQSKSEHEMRRFRLWERMAVSSGKYI